MNGSENQDRNIATYRLVSHAREFGIDRLRESTAILSAVLVRPVTKRRIDPSAALLRNTSQQQFELTPHQLGALIEEASKGDWPMRHKRLLMNRAIDGWHARRRRRAAPVGVAR